MFENERVAVMVVRDLASNTKFQTPLVLTRSQSPEEVIQYRTRAVRHPKKYADTWINSKLSRPLNEDPYPTAHSILACEFAFCLL
jgi:hypothetical protein